MYLAVLDIMAALAEAALAETAAAGVARGVGDRLDTGLVDPPMQIVFDIRLGEPFAGLVD